MKEQNKKLVEKAIFYLIYIFHSTKAITRDDIILTGSAALDLQGLLPEDREIHDVDLLVRMPSQNWTFLNMLSRIQSKTDSRCKSYGDSIMIKIDGVYLNIWNSYGKEDAELKSWELGVRVKSAGDILKEKKRYGRKKDYDDISDIVKNIL